MYKRNRELWLALAAMLLIGLLYAGVASRYGSIPAAHGFFGHSLGVIGLGMMLMTETLYSLRKRSHSARWGKMADWLSFHIFTGLVGPFLALLHTAWKFNGLAGLVILMTGIVVTSGFIGRYIYTSIPRRADGLEMQVDEVQATIARFEEKLAAAQAVSAGAAGQQSSGPGPLGQAILPLPGGPPPAALSRQQRAQYDELRRQQRVYQRQLANLATTRRLMATWHALHVPLGMAMFSAAFFHVAAAIYYATLLH